MTGEGLKELAALPKLATINMPGARITNSEVEAIAFITNLKELYLPVTDLTDEGVEQLSALTQLTHLDLGTCVEIVTDAGAKHLSSLTKLTYLGLRTTGITDNGLKELKRLTSEIARSVGHQSHQ